MLEADALQGVVELYVDAQIIGIQLELVAGFDAAIFVDIQMQGGYRPISAQAPVLVPIGMRVVGDGLPGGFGISHSLLRVV